MFWLGLFTGTKFDEVCTYSSHAYIHVYLCLLVLQKLQFCFVSFCCKMFCTVCAPNLHQCNNGQCVLRAEVCDGHNNCGDLSDELHCGTYTLSPFCGWPSLLWTWSVGLVGLSGNINKFCKWCSQPWTSTWHPISRVCRLRYRSLKSLNSLFTYMYKKLTGRWKILKIFDDTINCENEFTAKHTVLKLMVAALRPHTIYRVTSYLRLLVLFILTSSRISAS